jgi:CBS domain-containing protein
MRVDEVMSEAKCCVAKDTVRDAAKLMRDDNIGFVPICDENDAPIGAVTDRDLCIRVLAEGKSGDERLATVMTRETITCTVGQSVDDAERLMREHQTSRVMVCDDGGKLVGVISLHDIATAESDESTGRTLQDVKSDQPTAH